MHRFLERFSAFAGTAVIFVYLGSLFLGTATYFASQAIGVDLQVAAVTAFTLAAAFEVHSFLSQRLTRFWYQARAKLDQTQPEWDAADAQFRTHLWITVGLVAFSAFNSIAFWALVLHPADVGAWLQCFIRGAVTPAAFLAAGFLTPLQHDAAQMLQSASATMLRKTMRITLKQWQRRLEAARKSNVNLASVAVALMEDAHETAAARRLRIIDAALAEAEGKPAVRADRTPDHLAGPSTMMPDALSGPSVPLTANTGTDGQVAAAVRTSAAPARPDMGPHVIRLLQQAAPVKRQSPRTKRKETIKARKVRTGGTGYESYRDSMEAAYLQGATSVDQLMAATGAVRSTAAKWKAALDEKYVPAAQEA